MKGHNSDLSLDFRFHSRPGSPKGPNWRNEKSSKKGADENEPYAINIEKIAMKIV